MTTLEWAKSVPVLDVARALGMEIVENNARCWRLSNHKHGDRDPSVGLDTRRNKFRCYVCDQRSASTVDLVMAMRALTLSQALQWMQEHFGAPIEVTRSRRATPTVTHVTFETIVQSGLWASWSDSQRAIFGVLWTHRGSDATVGLGYGELLKLSGLGKRQTVADGTRFFEAVRLLDVHRSYKRRNVYIFLQRKRPINAPVR